MRNEDPGGASASASEDAIAGRHDADEAATRDARGRDLLRMVPFAVLAFVLFALLHDEAIAFTRQSARHIRAAHGLAQGAGLTLWDGSPFARFPPLFALLLAPFAASGAPVVASVAAIHALSFAAGAAGMHALGRLLRGPWMWLLPLAWCALGAHVAMLRAVRPDLIAIAATPFALLGAARYAAGARPDGAVAPAETVRNRRRALWMASLACSVALASRYMALFSLLPAVAAVVLPAAWRSARRREAALFVAVALGPLGAWLARNLLLTGYLLGMSRTEPRVTSQGLGASDHVHAFVHTLRLDLFSPSALGQRPLLYDGLVDTQAGIAALAAGLVLVATAGALVLARIAAPDAPARPAPAAQSTAPPTPASNAAAVRALATASALCAVLHVAALLLLWSFGNNDPIYTRYVAPLYTPLLALAACTASLGAGSARPRLVRGLLLGAIGIIVAMNLPKSAALLRAEPGEQLVERRTRGGKPRWFRELGWTATELGAPTGDETRRESPSATRAS